MVDTNVLVYAIDQQSGEKHQQANDLIQKLIDEKKLTVSAQILNEFYAITTRPHKPPSLSHAKATQAVIELIKTAIVIPLTPSTTLLALDAIPQHGFSFWDALIWAAAREGGVSVIHTEDFQDGRVIEGVRFANPFTA